MNQKNKLLTGPHQVELDSWIALAPFENLLNMEIQTAASGKAVLTMPFLHEYSQGVGIMHGGAVTALADTALAMAVKSLLPEGTHFGTTSLDIKLHRAVRQGWITAHAEITEQIERDLVGIVKVLDEEGEVVFSCSANFKIARKQRNLQAE